MFQRKGKESTKSKDGRKKETSGWDWRASGILEARWGGGNTPKERKSGRIKILE